MTYLSTPAESPLYAAEAEKLGYVPRYARVFALAPAAQAGWTHLATAVRDGMDLRRYELATLAAARALGSEYCADAHAVALGRLVGEDQLRAIVTDHRDAGLDPVDVAVMDFAAAVAVDPTRVPDPAPLRAHGLSDVEVFHVVLAACARRFFSGVLSAVDARPGAEYEGTLSPDIRTALAPESSR